MHRQLRKYLLLVLCIGLVFSFVSTALAETSTLEQVKHLLQAFYVKEVPAHVFNAESIEELLKRLSDPYTDYFTAEEYQEFLNGINMEFSGLGIYIDAQPKGIIVLSVIKDTPAEEVGLMPGDTIVEADGVSLVDSSNEQAISVLRGPEGSSVKLKVLRSEEILNFTITRRTVHVPTATAELLHGSIGYLDIDSFGSDTYRLIRDEIESLREKGAKSWIVDLRNNGGGYLSTAWEIAGLFIGNKPVVRWHERNVTYVFNGLQHEEVVDEPVIVLINQYSASAAEILASALKDHRAATLVGTTTYGKGTGQSMFRLLNGDVLKLTIAEFRSPAGTVIDKTGVAPHLETGEVDPLHVAALLLQSKQQPQNSTNYYKLVMPAANFYISTDMIRSQEHWRAWQVVYLQAPDDSLCFYSQGAWTKLIERTSLARGYYPHCFVFRERKGLTPDVKFLVLLSESKANLAASEQSITIVDTTTGQHVPVRLEPNSQGVKVIPQHKLSGGGSYWLVMDDSIFGRSMVMPIQVKPHDR